MRPVGRSGSRNGRARLTSRAKDGQRTGKVRERFNLNFEGDRLFWVLEKLGLAAPHLEANDAPIQERLQRALLEMAAVHSAGTPHDLREHLAPVRRAMSEVSLVMTPAEA